MPRLLLASSAPSVPTPEPLAKTGLNSTASITASSMTLTHWSRRSASRPLHDNTTEREQNPHSRHYNGLTHQGRSPALPGRQQKFDISRRRPPMKLGPREQPRPPREFHD